MRTKHLKTVKQVNVHIMHIMSLLGIVGLISIINLVSLSNINSASALTYQTKINNNFNINPSVSISLSSNELKIDSLTPGASSDSNVITLTAESNSKAGYTVEATVGNSTYDTVNLKHKDNGVNDVFSKLATVGTLDNGEWGYSYATTYDNSTSTWTNWSAYDNLPKYNSAEDSPFTLIDTSSATTSTIGFKIGAKATDTQAAGEYNNVINFIATAAPEPTPPPDYCKDSSYDCMQDLTLAQCSTKASSSNLTVMDKRDGSTYAVRYINDACWMTQNLRITGIISAEYSNFSNNNFNTNAGGDLKNDDYKQSYTEAMSHKADDEDAAASGSLGYTKEQLGAWYNYCAASAGEVCQNTTAQNATQDICPAGWHLPTFYDTEPESSLFSPLYGGHYDSGMLFNTTQYGRWWLSAADDASDQKTLYLNNSNIYFNYTSKSKGIYIRCIRTE